MRLGYVNTSSLRVSLPVHASSLDAIRLIVSTSTPSIAWNSRWPYWLSSIIFVGFSFLPGALWAGAITPTIAETQTTRILHIPTFQSQNLSAIWDSGSTDAPKTNGYGLSDLWMTNKGLFTFDLSVATLRGTFLEIASTASNTSKPDSSRRKFDQTGYRYLNRSYGVGAAAGLIDIPETIHPTWYSYQEVGFLPEVACGRNESSAFKISYLVNNDAQSYHEFTANGSLANGVYILPRYPQQTSQRQDIFAWAQQYDPAQKKTYMSLAVDTNTTLNDWDFHQFDKVQCEVNYQARNISVLVNATASTVSTREARSVTWPDYTDTVLQRLDDPFCRYSADEGMLFGSQLGHSIVMNINQLKMITGDNSTDTVYRGLEDHIASLFDNGLGMLSATRLIGANKTVPVVAEVGLPTVTYGDRIYIVAVLAINTIILLIWIAAAAWTRLWKGMANMELDDVGSVMLCASQGGTALAERAATMPDERIGSIRVRLKTISPDNREAFTLEQEKQGLNESGDHVQLLPMSSPRSK